MRMESGIKGLNSLAIINALKCIVKEKGGSENIPATLRAVRNQNASDPRDKYNSILGMLRRPREMDWGSRYDLTTEDLYILIARRFMTSSFVEGPLNILSDIYNPEGKGGPQLPSWVPNWAQQEVPEPPSIANYNACYQSKHCFRILYDKMLQIRGKHVDTIKITGDALDLATITNPTYLDNMNSIQRRRELARLCLEQCLDIFSKT
jgi:hypothetical protein